MGFSHAAHILMTVDVTIAGRCIHFDRLLPTHATDDRERHKGLEFEKRAPSSAPDVDAVKYESIEDEVCFDEDLSDAEWWKRQQARLRGADFASGCSLRAFYDVCRQAKQLSV